ncbi:MAG: AI-2E family transporter [Eubacterium sp.]|nr:AI-2E family transporter [Eubacterium sp.]
MNDRFEERYLKLGATIFAAGAGIVLFFFIVKNFDSVADGVKELVGILMPFIYGAVIAYLLSPVFNVVTRRTYHALTERKHKVKNKHRAFIYAKIVGTTVSILVLGIVITAFAVLLVPQMISSVIDLIEITPGRIRAFSAWLTEVTSGMENSVLTDVINSSVDNLYDIFMDFVRQHILPGVDSYMEIISQGIMITIRTFLDLLIGIIASVYFLNGKEKFKADARKTVQALCRRDIAKEIFDFCNYANRTFGGFIAGKVIDSIIVGFICYIAMLILQLPYAALCATIIGVTNIIPFFGPFIGAVPTSIIIFIQSPIEAGIFIILIFVLQQFDGNILGPKILGGAIGIASFWVMFSIVLFGGLFGFLGMVIGVPMFAILYYYFKRYVEKRLSRKGLPTDTRDYLEFNNYNINRKDIL